MGKGKYKRLSCSLGLEKKHKDGILPRKNKGVYLQMFAVIPSMKEKQHERKTFCAYWPFSYSACERKVGARNASSVWQYLCAIRNAVWAMLISSITIS